MKPILSLPKSIFVLRSILCALVLCEFLAAAFGSDGVNPPAERNAKFFAAQTKMLEGDKAPEVKLKEKEARHVREEARADREAADQVLRKSNVSVEEKERQARKAALSECKAETAQIALEEAMLDKVLSDDPSMADIVESQRKEIVVRKRMLTLVTNSARQQSANNPTRSKAAERKVKQ